MTKKLYYITIIISLLLIVGINVLIVSHFTHLKYIDAQGVVLGNFRQYETITLPADQPFTIKQAFVSTGDNLSKFTLTTKYSSQTNLHYSLQEQGGVNVRQGSVSLPLPEPHIQYIDWAFEPIENSQNKNYLLIISGQPGEGGINLFTVEPNRSDAANFILNGEEQLNSRLILDWRYFASHPINTMLNRLGYAKPGMFNHQISFIIIIVILEAFAFLLLWTLLVHFTITNKKQD